MPLLEQFQPNEQCLLALWEVTEEVDELKSQTHLTGREVEKLNSFGSSSRKKEFLVSRLMVQKLLGSEVRIGHNTDGKPHLLNSEWDISISHTKNLVGVLLGKDHDIALDIEYISERVEKVAPRFLNEPEMERICSEDRILHLYQHWCAKECLIKLLGKKDLHLTKELQIHPFRPTDETFSGSIHRDNIIRNYTFHHRLIGQNLMVWCCKPKNC